MAGLDDLWTRATALFERYAGRLWVRALVGVVAVCIHLGAFTAIGHQRLKVDFSTTSEDPYYSDPDAPATVGYPRQPHHWSRLIVSRWDAQHYVGFAIRGITSCPTDGGGDRQHKNGEYLSCGLGWLPAWGLAGGMVADVTGIAPDWALLLLSILSTICVTLLWTSRALVERIGLGGAYATLIAFHAFPTAFYLVTPFSDAATLALLLACVVCVLKDRWILAGVAVGAATALRLSAGAFSIGLACAAIYVAWQRRKAGTARWWLPLVAIPLAGWGQLVEVIFLQIFVGDWSAYFRAREAFGNPGGYARAIDPRWYLMGFNSQHADTVMLLGTIAITVGCGRSLLARFRREDRILIVVGTVVTMILSIGALLHWWGLNRYLLLCPLFTLCFGELVRTQKVLFGLWLALCISMYWHVELCSYVAQGNPGICPCLGKVEFTMPWKS
jgi:hypothetical protein